MSEHSVIEVMPLGFPWQTADPFLFCVHHNDAYPPGNEHMGPQASLAGRNIGADFGGKDGWSMYHGDVVPGFPQHPHRGFETITIARRGYIDHSDSTGATARFGHGDVQWMTAGKGVVHSEMFPLVNRDEPNPTELFQIWLNLPRADKMVDPYFTMFWAEKIPRLELRDENGRKTDVAVVAGKLGEAEPLAPPPNSWAARSQADVAVWTAQMEPGAAWTLPPASPESNRMVYCFVGDGVEIDGRSLPKGSAARLRPAATPTIVNGGSFGELLVLQGRPIGEPVAQHGPFVMNTVGEIRQAMLDYQMTRFGGWQFPTDAPVHPRERGRFAIHSDGREEYAD